MSSERIYDGVIYLAPDSIKLVENDKSDSNSLSLEIDGTVYNHVKVYRASPVARPNKYISLRIGASSSEEKELGIIRDLAELSPDLRQTLERELDKRYFVHIITKINSIKEEFSFLYWNVETDKGPIDFALPSRAHHRISEYGSEYGRLILDVDWNRYQIPDLRKLDSNSQKLFYRYIYW